jgi:hypothetical protein
MHESSLRHSDAKNDILFPITTTASAITREYDKRRLEI